MTTRGEFVFLTLRFIIPSGSVGIDQEHIYFVNPSKMDLSIRSELFSFRRRWIGVLIVDSPL